MNWLNVRHLFDISWGKELQIISTYLREEEKTVISKGPPGREPEAVTLTTCSSSLHSCNYPPVIMNIKRIWLISFRYPISGLTWHVYHFNVKRIRNNHWSVGHGNSAVLFIGTSIAFPNVSFVLDDDEGERKRKQYIKIICRLNLTFWVYWRRCP